MASDRLRTTTNLRFRRSPELKDDNVILTLPIGTDVQEIRKVGKWHEVSYQGKTGYVHEKHVQRIGIPLVSERPIQTKYKEVFYRTNKVSVGKNTKEYLIFHHSAGSFQGAINTILQTDRAAGYHCIIDLNGERAVFNNLDAILWHCGHSAIGNRTGINRFALGVCFTGDTTKRSLNDTELDSMIEWLKPIWTKYNFSLEKCFTHAQIATPKGRKIDVSNQAFAQIMAKIRTTLM